MPRRFSRIDEASDNVYKILKKYVSCTLEPYSVSKYHYDIGYRHRVNTYHDEKAVKITQEQADAFFKEDIKDLSRRWVYSVAHTLASNEGVVLNQNQFDALACYIYTIGEFNWMEIDHRDSNAINTLEVRRWITSEEIPTKPEPGNWWYEGALSSYKSNARSYIDSRMPYKMETFFFNNGRPDASISEYGDEVVDMLLSLFREIRDLYNSSVDDPSNYPQMIIKDNPYPHINPYEALSTLHSGEHDYIKWVQFEIQRTETINIDGKFTREFRDRLMEFQKSLGLEETGIIDYKLYESLNKRYEDAKNNQY